MINDFVSREDLPLFTSGSRFSLAKVFLKEGMKDTLATFDLLVRELPKTRNFLVFAGLEHVADYLLNLRFNEKQLQWIKRTFKFSPDVMRYFKNFRFTGNMWAMPEGAIFFPNEPIIRITAPIIEAQLIEMFLINTVFLQTILASKMSRFVAAAQGRETYLGFNRSYGIDAAMKSIRVGQIVGVGKQSLALAAFRNPTVPLMSRGTFHYLFQVFPNELDAMRAYMRYAPSEGSILIDTYGIERGLKNFIVAAKELKKKGYKVNRVMIDSGDLVSSSKLVRRELDKAGLHEVKIVLMGNLDEYKVEKLVKSGASADAFAGVTEVLNSTDAPTLEVIYKLAEIQQNKKFVPIMKTSVKKMSLPGRKQVFRVLRGGKYIRDIIGLGNEKAYGKKLLVPIIKGGKPTYRFPKLEGIREYYEQERKKFPERLFSINKKFNYPVRISRGLRSLIKTTKRTIREAHHDIDLS